MGLFQSKDAQKEYPLRIRFKDEVAYDDGGVSRDMFRKCISVETGSGEFFFWAHFGLRNFHALFFSG